MKKFALISVSDKTGLENLAKDISSLGYTILSTGGTFKFLQDKNIYAENIADYIGFPEILDGRVKTLHPKIHGGLLGDITNPKHLEDMLNNGINHIDIVVVNLYPFEKTISDINHTFNDAIQNIDIGGPSMIRSAAKNFKSVIVITDPSDYDMVLNELKQSNQLSLATRKLLAYKAFKTTCRYDFLIRSYLGEVTLEKDEFIVPKNKTVVMPDKIKLHYGENPHQNASLIKLNKNANSLSIIYGEKLQGKDISYNNINDGDAAISLLNELAWNKYCFVAIKHQNACGVGCDNNSSYQAWIKCYEGDKISIFGGIIATNCEVDEKLAFEMSKIFLEIIIAPEFSKEALAIFAKKPNLRIIKFSCKDKIIDANSYKTINGGVLMQTTPKKVSNFNEWQVVSKNQDSLKYLNDLQIAWIIVKYLKSNAICVVEKGQLLGIGVGQTNRYQSVKLALEQNKDKLTNAVLASDAFFPMDDSIVEIAKYPVKAIVQPGGSIKDKIVIDKVDEYNMIMLFTKERFFLH